MTLVTDQQREMLRRRLLARPASPAPNATVALVADLAGEASDASEPALAEDVRRAS
jgi:hypothetical protein